VAKNVAEGTISPITFEPYKIDDLGSLKYNGPGILSDNLSRMTMIQPQIKKSKDRNGFLDETIGMANFLTHKN